MKQVIIHRIKIDEKRQEQVIILKEVNGETLLPVVIGMAEVNAIKLKLSGMVPPRPLTHDLLNNVINELGATVEKVIIDLIDNKTFYAKIVLKKSNDEVILVDARPSDSIALALRADVPIFVEELVLEAAGMGE